MGTKSEEIFKQMEDLQKKVETLSERERLKFTAESLPRIGQPTWKRDLWYAVRNMALYGTPEKDPTKTKQKGGKA